MASASSSSNSASPCPITVYPRLDKKVVLISGASAGFGRTCARWFAASGSYLVLGARREDKLQALRTELLQAHPQLKVHVAHLDVTSRESVARFLSSIPAELAAIDIFLNNAGAALGLSTVLDAKDDDIDGMIKLNVNGSLNMLRAVVPGMVTRGRGDIVQMSSIAGCWPYAKGAVYCATKAALDAVTMSLRKELVATPIRIVSIAPGAVADTEFSVVRLGDAAAAAAVYEGWVGGPVCADDIADLVLYSVSRRPVVQLQNIVITHTNQASTELNFKETPKK